MASTENAKATNMSEEFVLSVDGTRKAADLMEKELCTAADLPTK